MASDTDHFIAHVKDAPYFEVPHAFGTGGKIHIPQPFAEKVVVGTVEKWEGFVITKFMIAEVAVAVLLILILVPLAKKIATGDRPRGRFWNFIEVLLVFIRDEVARPSIGKKDAAKFLPFLWTIFFFVLFCNVFGMLPWSGTATAALGATGALAFVSLCVTLGAGMSNLGLVGFWKAQVPHMGLPLPLAILLIPMIFLIELASLFIKHIMLSLRLLANMFAGHLVLAVLMSFIAATAGSGLWYGVMPATVFGCTAMSMLELFVAFLQAYIFTFLSALFIGMAVHPH